MHLLEETTGMKNQLITLVWAVGLHGAAFAQAAPLPILKDGDKWVYNVKVEQSPQGSTLRKWESSVVRASSSSVVIARKPQDSNLPPQEIAMAPDWSRSISVNGKTTTAVKNFDFPLDVGKKWEVSFTQEKPNDKVKLTKRKFLYKVIGWEEVKVAAGTFKALKIEADGEWYDEFFPTSVVAGSRVEASPAGSSVVMQTRNSSTPEPITGKYYKAIWYVPEVKREVKSVEESFSAAGNLGNRTTAELDSFQVQP